MPHDFNHPTRVKFCVFRHYPSISVVLLIGALLLRTQVKMEGQAFLALLGGIFVFAYSVQKQKHAEITLFKQLFSEFNKRYDRLNEKLHCIEQGPDDRPLRNEEEETLTDYFNLCGEEYLYYSHGFIYPEVWEAWFNGMTVFYRNKRVQNFWKKEKATGSYYGFSFEPNN